MARLIDAEKIEFMPKKDPLHGYPIMNKILFLGRSNGKTLAMVQEALKQSIENQPTVAAVPLKQYEDLLYRYNELRDNFIDYYCSGIPNVAPYCLNRCQECVDKHGWCKSDLDKCHGFNPAEVII